MKYTTARASEKNSYETAVKLANKYGGGVSLRIWPPTRTGYVGVVLMKAAGVIYRWKMPDPYPVPLIDRRLVLDEGENRD